MLFLLTNRLDGIGYLMPIRRQCNLAQNGKVDNQFGSQFDVIFGGTLAGTDLQTLVLNPSTLTSSAVPLTGVDGSSATEVQTLTFTGNITAGTFTLTYGALLTQNVNWDANPQTLLTNIQIRPGVCSVV